MRRLSSVACGVFLSFAVAAIAATGGGFPSRPAFQSVGIGTSAPAGSGGIIFGFAQTAANAGQTTTLDVSGGNNLRLGVGTNFTTITLGTATANPVINIPGSGALTVAGNITAAGQSVCRADGTNCPADSIGFAQTRVKAADQSVTSNVTLADDNTLVISGLSTGRSYAVEAFLIWDQAGSTTNGINVAISGANASISGFVCRSTINTTTANASETANGQGLNGSLSVTIGTAGLIEFMTCTGSATTTAGAASVAVRWAQAASVATATRVKTGSWLKITRLS